MTRPLTAGEMYAVAVRDKELFLFLRIRRNSKGEVFVMFPREGMFTEEKKAWNPHSSYHEDGRTHQKSFDQKLMVRQRPRPDKTFTGTQNIVATGITTEEAREINVRCQAK